jgi:hypothetical protein
MPKPYPDPSFNTTTGLVEHVNTLTNGWASTLVCIAIPVVVFIMMKTKFYKTSDSLMVSFFFGFLLASFFWASGLLIGKIVVLFLLFTLGSAIYSVFDG